MTSPLELSAVTEDIPSDWARKVDEESEKKAAEQLNRMRNMSDLEREIESFSLTFDRVLQTLDAEWRSRVVKNFKTIASELTVEWFLKFISYYRDQLKGKGDPDLNPWNYYYKWWKPSQNHDDKNIFTLDKWNNAVFLVERINEWFFKEAYTFDKVSDVLKSSWESLTMRNNLRRYKLKATFDSWSLIEKNTLFQEIF